MSLADPILYRRLPQTGDLLQREEVVQLTSRFSRPLVVSAVRSALAQLRDELRRGLHTESSLDARLAALPQAIEHALQQRLRPSLRRVINATGVILQTNMGRAPLSAAAIRHIEEIAGGYCNLEMDVGSGERSRRDVHVESLLLDLLAQRAGEPAETFHEGRGACVVNNCAAATFLALNTLAEGGEVIVSRGELVEIGGGFRIPDILMKSGAALREVGTTNKTRLSDYTEAITPQTRLLLRVHRSNFRIHGFTATPTLQDLVQLGRAHSIPVFEDQGTGCLVPLAEFGIEGEASWLQSAVSGVQLVAASGDKLLGGPQCGLLVGERAVIERMRANPLFRALRVDKLTYAALEATLLAYLAGQDESIPALSMMRTPAAQIRERCERWARALSCGRLSATVVAVQSVVGGGTTPGSVLPSFAVGLQHSTAGDEALAAGLRALDPPIIGRIQEGRVLLDLRTVPLEEDEALLPRLQQAFCAGKPPFEPVVPEDAR